MRRRRMRGCEVPPRIHHQAAENTMSLLSVYTTKEASYNINLCWRYGAIIRKFETQNSAVRKKDRTQFIQMTESTIKRQIMRFLKSLPESDWEVSPPGSVSGKPDITGCLKGRYVAIEVKRAGQYPTRLQAHKLKRLQDAKAVVGYVYHVEHVKELLDLHGLYCW